MTDPQPQLQPITRQNLEKVLSVELREGQDRFVAPVAVSLAEAYVDRHIAWPRAIQVGDEVVGFVMGGFSPHPTPFWPDGPLYALWRLNIDARHQGKGLGRFAAEAVAAEAARRGADRLTTFYLDEPGGPGPFYARLGFRPGGRQLGGQVVVHLELATWDRLAVEGRS